MMVGGLPAYGGSFSASTGSTTSAGGGIGMHGGSSTSDGSGSGGSVSVRRVRLSRPAPSAAPASNRRSGFGFNLRGGREHGTGFFITHVEPGSEAYNQGLKVGDQVVRVNGYKVSDALHREMLGLIASLNYLKLKVRNVGMVPVKERSCDPLTWRMVADPVYCDVAARGSPPLSNTNREVKDIRLTLLVPSRAKLGCGICKGPDWRPGIFVQFTKENGIARESGLRPGDQIMQCNGIDFREIQFSDAVSLMKQARRLDLWVRAGAGLDLFPGESSGYNSSASSNTGDQSPSSADHKRLSIVKEETMDLEDRLSQIDNGRYKRKPWDHRNFEWERENSIKESESESNYSYSDIQSSVHKTTYSTMTSNKDKSLIQNCTIINLSEKGTTIQSNYVVSTVEDSIYNGPSKFTSNTTHVDKKTVVVDVHRSEGETKSFGRENVTSIDCQSEENKPCLRKAPSVDCNVSLSNSTGSSLSNAISLEFQKRSERLKNSNFDVNQIEEMRKNKVLKGVDNEKKQKHDALMDEFKRAHKKMFSSNNDNATNGDSNPGSWDNSPSRDCTPGRDGVEVRQDVSERLSAPRQPSCERFNKGSEEIKTTSSVFASQDRPFNAYNGMSSSPRIQNGNNMNGVSSPARQNNVTNPHSNGTHAHTNGSHAHTNGTTTQTNGTNAHKNGTNAHSNGTHSISNGISETPKRNFKPPGQPPPPPPPMPNQNGNTKVITTVKSTTGHVKQKAPPPPPIKKNGHAVLQRVQESVAPDRPPTTPTPDYDTSSLVKVTSKPKLVKAKSDAVEMESLESFKIYDPAPTSPKPPSTYFMKQHNGMLTMKKSNPQVSVTIGEYPTNTFRKQPSKLEFLNSDAVDGPRKDAEPVGSRLQSELVQTLSRSNLKKKTETNYSEGN